MVLLSIDLKQLDSLIIPQQKWGYSEQEIYIAIQDMCSNGKPQANPEKQRNAFMALGGVVTKSSLEETGSSNV